MQVESIAEVLGGRPVLRDSVRTWEDLDRHVRAGLPKRSLQLVAQRMVEPRDVNKFVYSVVPPATFKRRRRLSAEESARTERLARVIARAEEAFGSQEYARTFLNNPHLLFESETPLNVARTEIGARRVEDLLYDVEHGLPL